MRSFAGISALILTTALAGAAELGLQPQPGVMLLRNGSTLEGNILRSGDRYEVGLKDGDLRVRASDVEFLGATLEDCYEHRRQGIQPDRVEDHLDLAEWCLRHQLHAETGRELGQAIACSPTHPKIPLLERRLRLAIDGPGDAPAAEPGRLNIATAEELDRMVCSMPSGTVETFTNVIQPMLLNQCSTAGCHGPASPTSLRLMRIGPNRTQSRRATQRNLHSVLGTIDNEHPDASPLLSMPVRPHGTSRAAVFTSKQAFQYKQLVDWTYAVANKHRVEPSTDAASPEGWPVAEANASKGDKKPDANPAVQSPTVAAKFLQRSTDFPQANSAEVVKTVRRSKSAPAGEQVKNEDAEKQDKEAEDPFANAARAPERLGRRYTAGQRPPRSIPKRGELPEAPAPTDPFDPEQFNRKYSGGK